MKDIVVARFAYDEEILNAFGTPWISWTQLEFQIQLLIWMLLEIEPKLGELITARQGMRQWLEHLKNLVYARQFDQIAKDDLQIVIADISKAQGLRDSLAHGLIGPSADPNCLVQKAVVNKGRKANKHMKSTIRQITIKQITEADDATQDALKKLIPTLKIIDLCAPIVSFRLSGFGAGWR